MRPRDREAFWKVGVMKKRYFIVLFLVIALSSIIFSSIIFINTEYFKDILIEKVESKLANFSITSKITTDNVSLFPPSLSIKTLKIQKDNKDILHLQKCSVKQSFLALLSYRADFAVLCGRGALFPQNSAFLKKLSKSASVLNRSKMNVGGNLEKKISLKIESLSIQFDDKHETFELYGGVARKKAYLTLSRKSRDGTISFLETTISMKKRQLDAVFQNFRIENLLKLLPFKNLPNVMGKIDGRVTISSKIANRFLIESETTILDLNLKHPLLGKSPFTASFLSINGDFLFERDRSQTSFQDLMISLNGLKTKVAGRYNLKGDFNLNIETESLTLNNLAHLLKNDLFADFNMDGTMTVAGEIEGNIDEESKSYKVSLTGSVDNARQLSQRHENFRASFPYSFKDISGDTYNFIVGDPNPYFIRLEELPEFVIRALILSEDAGFFFHKGIDFAEVESAVRDNMVKKRFRGGSTITQQLVKNLLLSREKSIMRKLNEAILSIELDATLSKERILEIYLNIVEWAPGIFGIGAAANYYFGKEPVNLEPHEAAYLASIIPGPHKYHVHFLKQKIHPRWHSRIDHLLSLLLETGYISEDQFNENYGREIIFRNPFTEPINESDFDSQIFRQL